jgi:hypothetical protein
MTPRQVVRHAEKKHLETDQKPVDIGFTGEDDAPLPQNDPFRAQACGPRAVLRLIIKR